MVRKSYWKNLLEMARFKEKNKEGMNVNYLILICVIWTLE